MKLLLALCLVATCSAAAVSYQASPMFTHDASELAVGGDSWQQAMTKAVAFLVASPLPSNWGQYMSTPTTQGSYGHSRVGFDNYEAEMSKWPIPAVFKQDAFACVGVLVLAASEGQYVGQSFVFSLSAGQGSLTSLVVVAKRDSQPSDPNRPVDVAYYVFSTSARVIQQYTYVQVKECSRCGKCLWIWKCCCSTKTNSIPRGFTPGEVLTVQYRMQRSQYDFYVSSPPRVALSASGSLQALKQLTAPSAPLQLGSNPVADILAALSRFIKRDDVRSEYSSNYTDPIVAELQNVTQTVYTSTSHSHLKGVKDELFDRMMVTLGKAYNVNEFIAPYVEVDRYAPAFSHEVLRQVENTTMMHYVWILGTRAEATGVHDVFLLSTKTQFDISRGNVSGDVNVVRNAVPTDDGDFESASFTVLEAPWGDNTTEVTMDILRFIAALTALKEPLPQPDPDNNPPTPDALVANLEQLVQEFNHPVTMVRGPADLGKAAFGVESVVALTMAVKAVADTWQSIANAFKTTVQTSVKQIIRLGFNHFQQKSTVLKAFGVAEDKVEPFVNMVVKAFQLPDDDKAKLVLFEMQYLPEASWDADDFMYAIPGTGSDKAFMMFKTGNSTSGLANFFIVNIEANFNLAPDLMVVRTQRSFLGGIFSDDKTVISEVPHVLSMSDAVNLQNFFKIIAIGKMCESLGIPYTFPELPPM